MTPEEYLRECHAESLPSWLSSLNPQDGLDPRILLGHLFASRVVFYPGSGNDGHAVKVFGSSHSSHCFVYADYHLSEASIHQALMPGAGFLGYRSLVRIDLQPDHLATAQWMPHITADEFRELQARNPYRRVHVYGFLEVLERVEHLDDTHGPQRLAILFLGADGHATYDALFCQLGQQAPFAVLLQDHGFAGNYSNWGRSGITARIAAATQRVPEFLLLDPTSTAPWIGYEQVNRVGSSVGGVWANKRTLYRRLAR